MPKLFIANATKHIQEFLFRIPGHPVTRPPFQQFIPMGQQVMVFKETDLKTLEYILGQHTDTPIPFCIPVDEAVKIRNFAGLVYSFDKPVPNMVIAERFHLNDEALDEMGEEMRKQAAVAANAALSEQADRTGLKLGAVEQSVVEEEKLNESEEAKSKKLQQTVAVSKKDRQKNGGKK